MTPDQYVDVVVLPTVREFFAKPNDRRLAYLSAISLYHVIDYLMRTSLPQSRSARDAELGRIAEAIRRRCPDAFDAVESMCHGTKHAGRDTGTRFTPGDEVEDRTRSGMPGFGKGGPPQPRLVLDLNGKQQPVDVAIRQFMIALGETFPAEFGRFIPSGLIP